ncbi:MAG: hypothetical protein ACKO8Z_11815 [Prosthecobacter sp.]
MVILNTEEPIEVAQKPSLAAMLFVEMCQPPSGLRDSTPDCRKAHTVVSMPSVVLVKAKTILVAPITEKLLS